MKVVVMSLGGSLIVPEKMEYKFLEDFKKTLRSHYKTHKFVIVCGGGTVARNYISILAKEGKPDRTLSEAGIMSTRMNAKFLMKLFGKEANDVLPRNMKEIKAALRKNNVVICGALRYVPHSTSDTTAAKLASYLKTDFINMTNIKGLYTANPKTHKNAKFIPYISWKKFEERALKIKFKNGQHFVLDQNASRMIKRHRIKTYIIGKSASTLNKIIAGKKFIGTLIAG